MSSDGGATWSAPVKINKTPTTIAAVDQQAWEPAIAIADDGSVAVTYYDLRNNVPGGPTLTDYWLVHADAGVDLTNPANWDELRLTDKSFDLQKAALPTAGNAADLGDYQSLVASGNSFGAFFSMTTKDGGPHLFFRDPPPAATPSATGVETVETLATDLLQVSLATGLGLFVAPAPFDRGAFPVPDTQGQRERTDLLPVLEYAASGVTADMPVGTQRTPFPDGSTDWAVVVEVLFIEDSQQSVI
jgi:hypothetical protein